jgi:hypothetical protein
MSSRNLRCLQGERGEAVDTTAAQPPGITRDRLMKLRAALERRTTAVPAPAGGVEQPPGHADPVDTDSVTGKTTKTLPGAQESTADLRGGATRSAKP